MCSELCLNDQSKSSVAKAKVHHFVCVQVCLCITYTCYLLTRNRWCKLVGKAHNIISIDSNRQVMHCIYQPNVERKRLCRIIRYIHILVDTQNSQALIDAHSYTQYIWITINSHTQREEGESEHEKSFSYSHKYAARNRCHTSQTSSKMSCCVALPFLLPYVVIICFRLPPSWNISFWLFPSLTLSTDKYHQFQFCVYVCVWLRILRLKKRRKWNETK